MNIMTINNVRGYIDSNGIAQLNMEDVSRGLGFTTVARSGNEIIRWARVEGYLSDLGFSTSGERSEYIPENIFYRLAMKAKNETAELFQSKVADHILPSIRKHGTYMTPETIEKTLTNPDFIIQLATQLKEEQKARMTVEKELQQQKPLISFAETCMTSDKSLLVREVAKLTSKNGVLIGEHRLFKKLRDWNLILQSRNEPTQKAMEMGLFEIKKGITQTPKGAKDYSTTKVTAKGQAYIINRLKKESNIS